MGAGGNFFSHSLARGTFPLASVTFLLFFFKHTREPTASPCAASPHLLQ